MGAPATKKRRLTHPNSKSFRVSEEFRKGRRILEGQPPLHCLTAFRRTDSFILGKELEMKNEVSIEYCVV